MSDKIENGAVPYGTAPIADAGSIPFPAYRGDEPYIFVSYAHADSPRVFEEIKRFRDAGYNVWYDEGIAPGMGWSDEIANALSGCAAFVVMLTPVSAPRENVNNEIEYALDEQKPFLAIHLEPTELTPGQRLRMGRKQAILRYRMSEEEYQRKIEEAFSGFGIGKNSVADEAPPAKEEKADAKEITIEALDKMVENYLRKLGGGKVATYRREDDESSEKEN